MNIEGQIRIRYEDLDEGAVFRKWGRVLIKTEGFYSHEGAVDLKTGEVISMLNDETVYPCKGKFVIEGNQ